MCICGFRAFTLVTADVVTLLDLLFCVGLVGVFVRAFGLCVLLCILFCVV